MCQIVPKCKAHHQTLHSQYRYQTYKLSLVVGCDLAISIYVVNNIDYMRTCVWHDNLHSWYILLWKPACCIIDQHTSFTHSSTKRILLLLFLHSHCLSSRSPYFVVLVRISIIIHNVVWTSWQTGSFYQSSYST